MMFAFIARHRHIWPVSWICKALEVSRSGFHAEGARCVGGMPPNSRNHRDPTGWDTPPSWAASSLDRPAAIAFQNRLRSSRFATPGRPGDRSGPRSFRSDPRLLFVIATSITGVVLRRPVESAQYTSEQFQRLLLDNGITCSMSRAGNVWDNSAMASFFSSLKTERMARNVFRTRDAARADVFDYIERFHNPRRRHSKLGYLSPMVFEDRAMLP